MGEFFQLDVDEFEELVFDAGEVPLRYQQVIGPCPRSVAIAGGLNHQDPGCPYCFGTGMIYEEYTADPGYTSGGALAIQSVQIGRTRAPVEVQEGDLTCTYIPRDYRMAAGDRVCFGSREAPISELVERGNYTVDPLKDLLAYRVAVAVSQVWGPSGRIAADFSLDASGNFLTWTGSGATPAKGIGYTVAYTYAPWWRVVPQSHYIRKKLEDGSQFPGRVVLRLDQQTDVDVARQRF